MAIDVVFVRSIFLYYDNYVFHITDNDEIW